MTLGSRDCKRWLSNCNLCQVTALASHGWLPESVLLQGFSHYWTLVVALRCEGKLWQNLKYQQVTSTSQTHPSGRIRRAPWAHREAYPFHCLRKNKHEKRQNSQVLFSLVAVACIAKWPCPLAQPFVESLGEDKVPRKVQYMFRTNLYVKHPAFWKNSLAQLT